MTNSCGDAEDRPKDGNSHENDPADGIAEGSSRDRCGENCGRIKVGGAGNNAGSQPAHPCQDTLRLGRISRSEMRVFFAQRREGNTKRTSKFGIMPLRSKDIT